jgi:hypothetical protein
MTSSQRPKLNQRLSRTSEQLHERLCVVEDLVTADATPDYIGFALARITKLERGSTVMILPSHLEDTVGALNALDTKAGTELTALLKVFDEVLERVLEARALFGIKLGIVPYAAGCSRVCGHAGD